MQKAARPPRTFYHLWDHSWGLECNPKVKKDTDELLQMVSYCLGTQKTSHTSRVLGELGLFSVEQRLQNLFQWLHGCFYRKQTMVLLGGTQVLLGGTQIISNRHRVQQGKFWLDRLWCWACWKRQDVTRHSWSLSFALHQEHHHTTKGPWIVFLMDTLWEQEIRQRSSCAALSA